MDSNSCPSPDALIQFAASELAADEREAIEEHIDGCALCRAQVAAVARDLVPSAVADSTDAETVRHGPGDEPFARKPKRELPTGGQVGRYRITRTIGAGGMGMVCLAEDPELQRRVALKFLSPELVGARDAAQIRARFLREGQAMAQLSHPNVVQVYDVGIYDGDVFLAMEYVEGEDLAQWLKRKRRSWREVLQVFLDAGRGLAAAHAVGLIHRDFKPNNVLIGHDGGVKVTDFGLARAANSAITDRDDTDRVRGPVTTPAQRLDAAVSDSSDEQLLRTPLTRTGVMMGTPGYMSPEQIYGEEVDERADVFSFCVALYEGLYGRRPFRGRNVDQLLTAIEEQRFEPGQSSRVPSRIGRAIRRGLRSRPGERFESMRALLSAIQPRGRRGGWMVAAGVSGLALAGAVAALALGSGSDEVECTSGAVEMAELWNPEVREALEASLKEKAGAAAWRRIDERLDDFAVEWAAMHRDSCRATHVHGTQSEQMLDLRTSCLEQQRGAFAQTLALLPKTAHAQAAAELTARLPAVVDCGKLDELARGPSLPADNKTRGEVLRARVRLSRAKMLGAAHHIDEGIEIALAVEAKADELLHPPLRAEALVVKGELQMLKLDSAAALVSLREAIKVAESSRHDVARIDAYIRLLGVLTATGNHSEAHSWAELAEGLAERVDDDGKRAGLADKMGQLYRAEGRFDDAAAAFERSIEYFQRSAGDSSFSIAAIALQAAQVLLDAGRFDEAYAAFSKAEGTSSELFGKNHPTTVHALFMAGHSRYEGGRPKEAIALWQDALARGTQEHGASHPVVLNMHSSIALAYSDMGDVAAAVESAQRAIAGVGRDHPLAVGGYLILGFIYLDDGRFEEAQRQFELALKIAEASPFVGDPETLVTIINAVGATFTRRKQSAKALPYLDRSMALIDKHLDPESPLVANTLTRYAHALTDVGRAGEAVDRAERALAIYAKRPPRPSQLASTKWEAARALWKTRRDRQRALALARESAELYRARGGRQAHEAKEILEWIGDRSP